MTPEPSASAISREHVATMNCCDFCGANADLPNPPTRRFIENPQHMNSKACICEECVKVCVAILANNIYWPQWPLEAAQQSIPKQEEQPA